MACEDLQRPDGAIVLVSGTGQREWFEKTHSIYGSADETQFYLGLTKSAAVAAKVFFLEQSGLYPAKNRYGPRPIRTSFKDGYRL